MIKIWDSAKVDRGGGAPIRTIKPQLPDKKPVQVSPMGGEMGCVWEVGGELGGTWEVRGEIGMCVWEVGGEIGVRERG